MILKNGTFEDLYGAMKALNKKYKLNACWNRKPERYGKHIRFTLRVRNSKGIGAKIGFSGRRTIHACWHLHGDFFDELFKINPECKVQTSLGGGAFIIDLHNGNWRDFNIGSIMRPMMASECCQCE